MLSSTSYSGRNIAEAAGWNKLSRACCRHALALAIHLLVLHLLVLNKCHCLKSPSL